MGILPRYSRRYFSNSFMLLSNTLRRGHGSSLVDSGRRKDSAGELLATYRTGLAPLPIKKSLRKDRPKRLYLFMCISRSVTGMSQKHILCEYAASVSSPSSSRVPPSNRRSPLSPSMHRLSSIGGNFKHPPFKMSFTSSEYCWSSGNPFPTKCVNSGETYRCVGIVRTSYAIPRTSGKVLVCASIHVGIIQFISHWSRGKR